MQFLLQWDDNSYRQTREVHDSAAEAAARMVRWLDGRTTWDHDIDEATLADSGYDDGEVPAITALTGALPCNTEAVADWLTHLDSGESVSVECEGGTFEVTRLS